MEKVQTITKKATRYAEEIANTTPVDYEKVSVLLGAVSGVFQVSGNSGISASMYDRLPEEAQQASWVTATTCRSLLGRIRMARHMDYMFSVRCEEPAHARDRDAFFMGALQNYLSYVAVSGDSHLIGRRLGGDDKEKQRALEVFEVELRDGVRLFGESLGFLLRGYVRVASARAHTEVVARAADCLSQLAT